MRGSKVLPAVLLPFLGLGLGACSDSSTEPALDDVQIIRQATQKYQDLQAAQADGFAPLSPCVASPAGSGMTLVGVEFMVPRDALYGAGNSAPPAVAGQTFDPPNPQHPDEMLREMYTPMSGPGVTTPAECSRRSTLMGAVATTAGATTTTTEEPRRSEVDAPQRTCRRVRPGAPTGLAAAARPVKFGVRRGPWNRIHIPGTVGRS